MTSLRRKERQLLQLLQQHNNEHCNLNKRAELSSTALQRLSTDDLLLTDSMEATNFYDTLPEQQMYLLPTSEPTQLVHSDCTIQSPMIAQCLPSQPLSKSMNHFHHHPPHHHLHQPTDHQTQLNSNYVQTSNQTNAALNPPLPPSSANAQFSCNQDYSLSINYH